MVAETREDNDLATDVPDTSATAAIEANEAAGPDLVPFDMDQDPPDDIFSSIGTLTDQQIGKLLFDPAVSSEKKELLRSEFTRRMDNSPNGKETTLMQPSQAAVDEQIRWDDLPETEERIERFTVSDADLEALKVANAESKIDIDTDLSKDNVTQELYKRLEKGLGYLSETEDASIYKGPGSYDTVSSDVHSPGAREKAESERETADSQATKLLTELSGLRTIFEARGLLKKLQEINPKTDIVVSAIHRAEEKINQMQINSCTSLAELRRLQDQLLEANPQLLMLFQAKEKELTPQAIREEAA